MRKGPPTSRRDLRSCANPAPPLILADSVYVFARAWLDGLCAVCQRYHRHQRHILGNAFLRIETTCATVTLLSEDGIFSLSAGSLPQLSQDTPRSLRALSASTTMRCGHGSARSHPDPSRRPPGAKAAFGAGFGRGGLTPQTSLGAAPEPPPQDSDDRQHGDRLPTRRVPCALR